MRSNRVFPVLNPVSEGVSLIELAMVMVIVALALVPLVKMMGGPTSQSGGGSAIQLTGVKNKEALFANTLVNKLLAQDFRPLECRFEGANLSVSDFPQNSSEVNYPRSTTPCKMNYGNNLFHYQWKVVKLDKNNNRSDMPNGNNYYQATLTMLDASLKPIFTMPMNFFRPDTLEDEKTTQTGVMVAMDRSGSMAWPLINGALPTYTPSSDMHYASPFMFYRYDKNLFTGNSWGYNFSANSPTDHAFLDRWDNRQLDMFSGRNYPQGSLKKGEDPDTSTPNNEAFPMAVAHSSTQPATGDDWGKGLLGTGDCSSTAPGQWTGSDKNLAHTFMPWARNTGSVRNHLISLCERQTNQASWQNSVNTALSRFEAARTASLALMLKLEEKKQVAESIEMGFFPWGSYAAAGAQPAGKNYEAKLAPVTTVNGKRVFKDVRERLLWLNRANPANNSSKLPIIMEGGTDIYRGLDYARAQLQSKNYDRRIIVLLTDGEPFPNSGSNSNAGFGGGGLRDYTKQQIGCGVADKDKRITLFAVGLIKADFKLMADMANSTPSGQAFNATDTSQLAPIFDTIAYQIQKLALLSTASRYGLELSEGDDCP